MATLKEILNLDKAEVVFQRLLEAVEAHSSELDAVRRDVSRKAGVDDLRSMCTEISGRLAALERRVEATETAVAIPEACDGSGGGGRGGDVTVGQAVRANREAFLDLSKKLAGKAGQEELAAKGVELEACIRERERAVRQWGVGRDFADSLGRANRGLAEKLLAVEGVLGTKMDRSELDNMQAACAKVSTVSDFLDDAAQRVSKLEADLERGERARRRNEQGVEEAFRALRADLIQKAEKRTSEAVAEDVADLRRAFVEETGSKTKQLRGLRHQTGELKKSLGNFSGSSNERLRKVELHLERTATRDEVARKADARSTEEALRVLSADCGLRARQTSLSELASTVSCLEREHAKTRKASDLTGRFVDWFSARGQAYEHNISAVEKHIENLATRSVGARASPAAEAAAALDAARGAQRVARSRGGGGGADLRSETEFSSTGRGVHATRAGGGRVPYGGGMRFTPA